jgi:hypothetical protein
VSEATPVAPAAERGFFEKLMALYVSPTEAFRAIVARPKVLVPFLVLILLAGGFVGLWVSKADPVAFHRDQLEQSSWAQKMTPEQKEAQIQQQAKFFPLTPVFVVVGGSVFYVLTALVYLGIFRFLYGADLRFKQSLAITLWSFLAVAIVWTPLTLAVYALKGDWNLDPGSVVQANLSLLLDKATAPKWLYALATSLDLNSFWHLGLLAAGYGVASRRTLGGALPGVLAPWVVIVLIKVGFTMIMG